MASHEGMLENDAFQMAVTFSWANQLTGDALWLLTYILVNKGSNKSALVQVMAWCRQASSHYLNQCWLIIDGIMWHSLASHCIGSAQILYWLLQHLPGTNELNPICVAGMDTPPPYNLFSPVQFPTLGYSCTAAYPVPLTHCDLVTPYDKIDLGQQWPVIWRHQAICRTKFYWSSVKPCIYLTTVSQEMIQKFVLYFICLKFTNLRLQPPLPEADELILWLLREIIISDCYKWHITTEVDICLCGNDIFTVILGNKFLFSFKFQWCLFISSRWQFNIDSGICLARDRRQAITNTNDYPVVFNEF